MLDETIEQELKTERLIAAKRHKELLAEQKEHFGRLAVALNKKDNDNVTKAITEHTEEVRSLVIAILNQQKPENPNVTVELKQDELVSSMASLEQGIRSILEGQEKIIEQLKIMNQPKEYVLEFKRERYSQIIESPITAKMIYTKPKYQA